MVIDAAMDVHRELGPGLLESVYRTCLVYELRTRGLRVEAELLLSLRFRGLHLPRAYRVDVMVQDLVLLELKSVYTLDSVHAAQLLTYLRLTKKRLGFLINFNVPLLKHGIRRLILTP